MNGLYESFIILLAFPLIVYLGASGELKSKRGSQICRFLGDISYPVYLINYPIIYIFTGWVSNTTSTVGESLWQALLTFVVTIAISYISMKCFDKPVRNWLKKKFLK
jgi:peptidoglycan/LPS O-acetylase OafA/YrhL